MTAFSRQSSWQVYLVFAVILFSIDISAQETKAKEFEWNGVTYIPGLTYRVYHGQWEKIPDFSSQEIIKSGEVPNFSLDIRDQDDYFGVEFSGFIRLPKDGEYTFFLSSDDGSKLFIDDKELIDNDGLHGVAEKSASITLKKGVYPIKVLFFENAGEEVLSVKCEGPGIEKQDIPAKALFQKKK